MPLNHDLAPNPSTAPPDGVENWAESVRQQQATIQTQQQTIQAQQETIETLAQQLQHQQERIDQLEAELLIGAENFYQSHVRQ